MADAPVTDAELIARALVADDRHAFAELVKRHQSSVRACLRRLTAGNHALADDLAQDTFVLAWRNLKSFRQEATLLDVAVPHRHQLLAGRRAQAQGRAAGRSRGRGR